MAVVAGDRARDSALNMAGTVLATGVVLEIHHPDGTPETIEEGVIFQPDGSDENYLTHNTELEKI